MSQAKCRSGCPTQDHSSWGECLRASNLRIAYCGINGGDATKQKKWDAELQEYRDARAQGIEPASTRTKDIREAVKQSDIRGEAVSYW